MIGRRRCPSVGWTSGDSLTPMVKKVKAAREKALAERYPQGAKFDK